MLKFVGSLGSKLYKFLRLEWTYVHLNGHEVTGQFPLASCRNSVHKFGFEVNNILGETRFYGLDTIWCSQGWRTTCLVLTVLIGIAPIFYGLAIAHKHMFMKYNGKHNINFSNTNKRVITWSGHSGGYKSKRRKFQRLVPFIRDVLQQYKQREQCLNHINASSRQKLLIAST